MLGAVQFIIFYTPVLFLKSLRIHIATKLLNVSVVLYECWTWKLNLHSNSSLFH
jgi:hypothetical protein